MSSTDKAQLRKLSDKFLRMIERLLEEIKTRTAPDSKRLEGRNTTELKDYLFNGGDAVVTHQELADVIWCQSTDWEDNQRLLEGYSILEFEELKLDTSAQIIEMVGDGEGRWLAMSANSELFISKDDTKSWKAYETDDVFVDIKYRNGKVYAIDQYGTFFRSDDWCESYLRIIATKEVANFKWIRFGALNEITMGGGAETLVSYDDGASWQLINTSLRFVDAVQTWTGYWLLVTDDHIVYEAEGVDLRRSTLKPILKLSEPIINITLEENKRILLLTESSKVYRFQYQTKKWDDVTPIGKFNIMRLVSDHIGLVIAVTDTDHLLRSYDYGENWGCVMMDYKYPIHDAVTALNHGDLSKAALFGENGYVLLSGTNAGTIREEDWELPDVGDLLDYADINVPMGAVALDDNALIPMEDLPTVHAVDRSINRET